MKIHCTIVSVVKYREIFQVYNSNDSVAVCGSVSIFQNSIQNAQDLFKYIVYCLKSINFTTKWTKKQIKNHHICPNLLCGFQLGQEQQLYISSALSYIQSKVTASSLTTSCWVQSTLSSHQVAGEGRY